ASRTYCIIPPRRALSTTAPPPVHPPFGQAVVRPRWLAFARTRYTGGPVNCRRHRVRVAALALLAAGCGGSPPNPYPQEVVDNFVTSCPTHAHESGCPRAIDPIPPAPSPHHVRALADGLRRRGRSNA